MPKKLNFEDFINQSKTHHGDKYDYSRSVYVNAKTKIEIICPSHGSFYQIPDSHKKCGCPKCGSQLAASKQKLEKDEVIAQFIEIHGHKYDYSLVDYKNNSSLLTIICKVHGEFHLSAHKHKNGRGCQECGKSERLDKFKKVMSGKPSPKRLSYDDFLLRATSKHNGKYSYEPNLNFLGSKSLVSIICPEHGKFERVAEKHLIGRGCPHCKRSKQYSNISLTWLKSLGINLIYEYRLPDWPTKKVDAYDPITNTIFQFHGDYWHGNPTRHNREDINKTCGVTFGQLYDSTIQSDEKLISMGYSLVVMWESEWKSHITKT
jgi:hypothetical protein